MKEDQKLVNHIDNITYIDRPKQDGRFQDLNRL